MNAAAEHTTFFYAHSVKNQPVTTWHRLDDHLAAVAEQAEKFATGCVPRAYTDYAVTVDTANVPAGITILEKKP